MRSKPSYGNMYHGQLSFFTVKASPYGDMIGPPCDMTPHLNSLFAISFVRWTLDLSRCDSYETKDLEDVCLATVDCSEAHATRTLGC